VYYFLLPVSVQQRLRTRARTVLRNYLDRTENAIIVNTRKNSNYQISSIATRVYRFVPKPSKLIWENQNRLLGSLHLSQYFSRPSNMAFHNLCTTAQKPPGTEFLLGLGLKYCIESPIPFQRVEKLIRQIQRSVRLHFAFKDQDEDSELEDKSVEAETSRVQYVPSLYLPSGWQPPPAPDDAENAMSKFDEWLTALIRALPCSRRYNPSRPQRQYLGDLAQPPRRYNPSRPQRQYLGDLAQRQDLIIFPTNKNLGPSIAERQPYIRQSLAEHLHNEDNYQYLPTEDATIKLAAQRCRFLKIHSDWSDMLPSEAEKTYFKCALLNKDNLGQTRVPPFYGCYKVHMNGKPKTWPSVSLVNSIPGIFSKWVDYRIKKVVRQILPTYIRDADHLLTELQRIFPNGLPPGAHLFSVDAVGMYSNIDTEHGIEVLTQWLCDYGNDLPTCLPMDFAEIMRSNIFQFGDTFWKQTWGCAMGTSSAAVNYAYLYVGLLEVQHLLPHFESCLPFFKRFIDDGIRVWMPQPNNNLAWNAFLRYLNRWWTLHWTCDGHVDSLIVLDLHISIGRDRHLIFKACTKNR
jgi:hypothetical protein